MTSTDTEPVTYDPLADLTINELNDGARQLKASLVIAITGQTENYERALAVLLWLHTRRTDPGVGLTRFLEMSFADLTDQLELLGPADQRPTTPSPSPG